MQNIFNTYHTIKSTSTTRGAVKLLLTGLLLTGASASFDAGALSPDAKTLYELRPATKPDIALDNNGSCGPQAMAKYTIQPDTTYSYAFRIKPLR